MATETANPVSKYIRKHLNQQARRTGKPLLGRDWEKHAAVTDPEHHYRHMQVHEDAAERERAAGNHEKAKQHEHWAKGHHALARNKMSHIEWRKNIEHSSAETTHRVGVTVSEPDHPAASQRGEHHQRTFRTKALSPDHALSKARNHYKKQGYKVHDAWHIEQASVDPNLVSQVMDHPLVKEHPHSVFHQHDGEKHHVEFGGGEHEKSGHGSHHDLHTAISHASADYHLRNKKWSTAASPHSDAPESHHEAVNHIHSLGEHTKEHQMGLPTHTSAIPKGKHGDLHSKLVGSGFHHKAAPFGPRDSIKHRYTKGDTVVDVQEPHYTDHEHPGLTHHKVQVQSNYHKARSAETASALHPGRSWKQHAQVRSKAHHLKQIAWHAAKMRNLVIKEKHARATGEVLHSAELMRKINKHTRWIKKHRSML